MYTVTYCAEGCMDKKIGETVRLGAAITLIENHSGLAAHLVGFEKGIAVFNVGTSDDRLKNNARSDRVCYAIAESF